MHSEIKVRAVSLAADQISLLPHPKPTVAPSCAFRMKLERHNAT